MDMVFCNRALRIIDLSRVIPGEKMSSSKPESAMFLTDMPKEVAKKIMQAKTGGAISLEEQKCSSGKSNECMVYELF